MKEEAKKLWKTPQGASLLRSMLAGKMPDEISPEERETLNQLKEADPPHLETPDKNRSD